MIKKYVYLLMHIGLCLSISKTFAKETLVVAYSELPPWKVINNGKIEGAYAEIARELAQRLNMHIVFKECSLMRCLQIIKDGQADIIIGIQIVAERLDYIQPLKPAIKRSPAKVFYLKKDTKYIINDYEDLKGIKSIGTQRGSKYFSKFDNDLTLNKHEVTHDAQIFSMLLRGRVDAIIINEEQGEYMLSKLEIRDEIKKANYSYNDENPRYIGMSKKSAHNKNINLFEIAIKNISDSDKLEQIMNEHFFIKNKIPTDAIIWK